MSNRGLFGEFVDVEATKESTAASLGRLMMYEQMFQELNDSFFKITFVAPLLPREQMVRYADGTRWNPGSGKGYYFFNGTTWVAMF